MWERYRVWRGAGQQQNKPSLAASGVDSIGEDGSLVGFRNRLGNGKAELKIATEPHSHGRLQGNKVKDKRSGASCCKYSSGEHDLTPPTTSPS